MLLLMALRATMRRQHERRCLQLPHGTVYVAQPAIVFRKHLANRRTA